MSRRVVHLFSAANGRKLTFGICALCASLVLSACGGGGGGGGGNTPSTPNPPNPPNQPETAVWGQSNWDEAEWQ